MKTSVNLPDQLVAKLNLFAQQRDLSQSELCGRALDEFLLRHRQDKVTEKINATMQNIEKPRNEMGLQTLRNLPW
jgi:predicted transcriptional regulator